MKKGITFLTVLTIASILLGGCTQTPDQTTPHLIPSPSTQSESSSPSTGTLTVLVTDAPSYTVNSVIVHFSEVWAHKASDREDGEGEWIQLSITGGMLENGSFDLAELRDEGETAELAAAELVTGEYTQLRVVMDEDKGVQVDYDENTGEPVNAKLPSGTLKFVRTFIVEADGSTDIVLDFDLQKSVVFTGNFDNGLNPNQADKPSVIVKPVVKLQVTSTDAKCKLDGELKLENKDQDNDWAIISDDEIYGELRYSTKGENFCYDFQGFGLDDIEYSLIYYADTEDRYNEWSGDNPGALIASGNAVAGNLTLTGSIFLGMDLPHPDDANGYFYDYTEAPDSYPNPTGAKIWLVPSECYDADDIKVISWEPERFLFETDLIEYEYNDSTAPAKPINLEATSGNTEISLD
jgi:hypothetical protein